MKSKPNIFSNFLMGVATSNQLLNFSKQKGCFIESVCLSANIIDALLRIGLVLKYQLDNNTDNIKYELLFQSETDKIISERHIYKKAFEADLINKLTFDNLELLYNKRNIVVHRYIISELTTDDIILVAQEYENIIDAIKETIHQLEFKQIEEKVGMTASEDKVPIDVKRKVEKSIEEMIMVKHGNDYLYKKLKS